MMATYTPNLNLKKPGSDDFVDIADINGNMDAIDTAVGDHIADTDLHVTAEKQAEWDSLKTFQTAGGTGTAITLTGVELVDGFHITFVILASNSGVATTINTKPLYKPGTIAAPKLVAGKAATVWYNTAGGCFFIKASAEGTAVAGDVLAGKTFSNDDDVGVVGTLSLTGSAVSADVSNGKTFYNTDAKVRLTGTNADKKWASGTVATGSNLLQVTGLTFKPSLIKINYGTSAGNWLYNWAIIDTRVRNQYSYFNQIFYDKSEQFGSFVTITDTGFSITGDGLIDGNLFSWIAYE